MNIHSYSNGLHRFGLIYEGKSKPVRHSWMWLARSFFRELGLRHAWPMIRDLLRLTTYHQNYTNRLQVLNDAECSIPSFNFYIFSCMFTHLTVPVTFVRIAVLIDPQAVSGLLRLPRVIQQVIIPQSKRSKTLMVWLKKSYSNWLNFLGGISLP